MSTNPLSTTTKIPFLTPVVLDKANYPKNKILKAITIFSSLADHYAFLGKNQFDVKTQQMIPIKHRVAKTIAKVVSFVLTGSISFFIALGIKAIYKNSFKNDFIKQPKLENVNESKTAEENPVDLSKSTPRRLSTPTNLEDQQPESLEASEQSLSEEFDLEGLPDLSFEQFEPVSEGLNAEEYDLIEGLIELLQKALDEKKPTAVIQTLINEKNMHLFVEAQLSAIHNDPLTDEEIFKKLLNLQALQEVNFPFNENCLNMANTILFEQKLPSRDEVAAQLVEGQILVKMGSKRPKLPPEYIGLNYFIERLMGKILSANGKQLGNFLAKLKLSPTQKKMAQEIVLEQAADRSQMQNKGVHARSPSGNLFAVGNVKKQRYFVKDAKGKRRSMYTFRIAGLNKNDIGKANPLSDSNAWRHVRQPTDNSTLSSNPESMAGTVVVDGRPLDTDYGTVFVNGNQLESEKEEDYGTVVVNGRPLSTMDPLVEATEDSDSWEYDDTAPEATDTTKVRIRKPRN